MKQIYLLTVLTWCLSNPLQAQDVTYAKDVAQILYDNCTSCHRPGEIGPFSLTNYDEAATWANAIKYVTTIKYMPPWPPNRDYSHFIGERGLTDDEIQKLAQWADEGAPRGNPDDEPSVPTFPDGSQLGTPDLVLSFAESYQHKGTNVDDYRVFVLPTNLAEDKIVKAVELRAGNRKIVHHALISYDATGLAQQLDDETPEYGYQSFGGFGDGLEEAFNRQFPGYVPGQTPRFFPDGLGQLLPAGSDLLLQIHYAPFPVDQWDSTSVNIFFADESEVVDRMVQDYVMTPFSAIGEPSQFLRLPPNEVSTYHYYLPNVPADISIMAIWPHMHLLGQNWHVYSVLGSDTTNLIKIDEWDFNWQGVYNYKRFQKIPQGSTLHAWATYDNTSNNPLNPNDPPKLVTWGEKTTDEMFFLPVSYVPYREGDEDIDLEGVSSTYNPPSQEKGDRLLAPWPNPAVSSIDIRFDMKKSSEVTISIFNIEGKRMSTVSRDEPFTAGNHVVNHNIEQFGLGTYFIEFVSNGIKQYQMFQKL